MKSSLNAPLNVKIRKDTQTGVGGVYKSKLSDPLDIKELDKQLYGGYTKKVKSDNPITATAVSLPLTKEAGNRPLVPPMSSTGRKLSAGQGGFEYGTPQREVKFIPQTIRNTQGNDGIKSGDEINRQIGQLVNPVSINNMSPGAGALPKLPTKSNAGFAVAAMHKAINDTGSGIASTVDMILPNEWLGKYDFIEPIFEATKKGHKQAVEGYDKSVGDSKGKKFVGDIISGVTSGGLNMGLALLTGGTSAVAQLGKSAPGLLGSVSMAFKNMMKNPMYWSSFLQTAGNTFDDAKANGANDGQAFVTATMSGLLNAGVEIGGGVETLPSKLISGKGNVVGAWVKSMFDEGKEEVIQGVIENLTKKTFYAKDTPFVSMSDDRAVINPKRALGEFGMGATIGGILGGGQVLVNSAANVTQVLPQRDAGKHTGLPLQDGTVVQDGVAAQGNVAAIQESAETNVAGASVQGSDAVYKTKATPQAPLANAVGSVYNNTPMDIAFNDTNIEQSKTAVNNPYMQEGFDNTAREQMPDRIKSIAKRLGVEVSFDESISENGSYSNGRITINPKNKTPVLNTFVHELTHHLEQSGKYTDFANAVMDSDAFSSELNRNNFNVAEYRQSVKDLYLKQKGQELDDLGADREMVAKFAEKFLTDEKTIARLAQTNVTLFERIRQWVDDMAVKFRGTSEEQGLLKIRKLYVDATKTAEEQASSGAQYSLNPSFATDFDNWANKLNRGNDLKLKVGRTSEALKSIGVKDQDIIWQTSKINKTQAKHAYMTDDVLKQVPQILENPVIVMQSKVKGSRITIFGEVYDAHGLPVLAVLELEPDNDKHTVVLDEMRVASTYSKKEVNAPQDTRQTQGVINSSKVLYVEPNKNRTNNWLSRNRLQLPFWITNYGSIGSVSYDKTVVNSQYMQNKKNNALRDKTAIEMALEKAKSAEKDKQYSVKNPVEIGKMTEEQANTTPKLEKTTPAEGGKQSSFAGNVQRASIFDDKFKSLAASDKGINTYDGITNKETIELANEAINTGGLAYVTKWYSKKQDFTAEDIATGYILMNRYQKIGDYQSEVEVARKLREMGTGAGQTVQAFAILGRMTPQGMIMYAQGELSAALKVMAEGKTQTWISENADKLKLNERDIEYISRRTLQAAQLPDGRDKNILLGEIAARIQNKIPPLAGQRIKALARISMLLNPKTNVRNVLGNASIVPLHLASDFIGAGIDKAIASKTGTRTTGLPNSNLKAFGVGVYESWDDFRRKINTRDMGGDRFEIGDGQSFGQSPIGKALNAVDRFTGFLLDAGDRGFYQSWFINALNNQMRLNHVSKPTADMINIASIEALQRTWQDTNGYTKAVSGVRKMLNAVHLPKGYGLGDMIMPFIKTPANLTKAIVDFSPIGLTTALARDLRMFNIAVKNGTATPQMQKALVKNLSQGIAGTMMSIFFAFLANAGVLSGEGEKDKDLANFKKNILGQQPYSVKIGDRTYSYAWVQPMAGTAAIVTDMVNSIKSKSPKQYTEGDDTVSKYINGTLSALKSGGNVLFEQSFMQSLQNLFSEDGIVQGVIETALSEPAKFAPQMMAQFAQLRDDTLRTSYVYNQPLQTAINKVKAKIPGLSETLEPVVDVLGRDVKRNGGNNSIGNVFFSPANVATAKPTKSADEVYRLYVSTGDKAVIPPTAPYYFEYKGKKIILTPKEKTEFQRITGKLSDREIQALLKTNEYKAMADTDKATLIKEVYSYATALAKSKTSDYVLDGINLKAKKAEEKGVPIYKYFAIKQSADTDGTVGVTQAEMKSALDSTDLSRQNKAYLFELQNKNWVNNPYR